MATLTRPRQASDVSRYVTPGAVPAVEHRLAQQAHIQRNEGGSTLLAAYGIVAEIAWHEVRRRWFRRSQRTTLKARVT